MSSLGEISWINKNIDDSPLETNKLLFKLIFGESVRFNRKKLKSFTGFHLDHDNVKIKVDKVAEEFCVCKLKTVTNLLSSEQLDTGREMAEFICILLNDVNKLQQELLDYVECKRAVSETEDCGKSNQQTHGSIETTSFQGNEESSQHANLNLNNIHAANPESEIIPTYQESWQRSELHSSQFPGAPQYSRKLGDSLVPAFTVNIKLEDLGCNVEAILDTGSPISFLRVGMLPERVQCEKYDNQHQFRGISGSKINIIGRIKQRVVTQECDKLVCFYVIPNGILNHSCLLGRDYISQILLTINGGISFISDKTDENIF